VKELTTKVTIFSVKELTTKVTIFSVKELTTKVTIFSAVVTCPSSKVDTHTMSKSLTV
jgi:hypothetical protein